MSTTVEQAGIEFDSARARFRQRRAAHHRRRDEQSWVAELAPSAATDPVGHVAFVHAHPRWIAQAFADALGADAGETGRAAGQPTTNGPLVHLAARPGVLTADELADAGRTARSAATRRTRSYLSGGDPGRLRAVRDGAALVQDEGSQLVARALTLAPVDGRRRPLAGPVRGPGRQDRAARRARRAERGARVTAVEPRRAPRRAGRAEHPRAARRRACGSTAATPGSSRRLRPGAGRRAVHRARARCAAGRRRAGGASPPMCPTLAKLQRELLASAIALTRPGGVVLYATCSPHLAETVGVVADALRRQPVTALDARPLFEPASTISATGRTCSCGRTGTAPTRCSRAAPTAAQLGVSAPCRVHAAPLIAPSILAADFARLADEAAAVTAPTGCTST